MDGPPDEDRSAAEQAAEQMAEATGGMPVLTKQVVYANCPIGVQTTPTGEKRIQVVDFASGTVHVVPLDSENSRQLGKELLSAHIEVPASELIVP